MEFIGRLSQSEVTEIYKSLQGFRSNLSQSFNEAMQRSNRITEIFK